MEKLSRYEQETIINFTKNIPKAQDFSFVFSFMLPPYKSQILHALIILSCFLIFGSYFFSQYNSAHAGENPARKATFWDAICDMEVP